MLATCRLKRRKCNILGSLIYVHGVSSSFLSLLEILLAPVVFLTNLAWMVSSRTNELPELPHSPPQNCQRCSLRLSDFHLSFLLSKLASWQALSFQISLLATVPVQAVCHWQAKYASRQQRLDISFFCHAPLLLCAEV